MATEIGVAAVLLIFGIIVLIGKGDFLIAGFNTASEEEKDKYDRKKLRLLVGGLCILAAIMCGPVHILLARSEASATLLKISTGLAFLAAGAVIVLANTWAKKK